MPVIRRPQGIRPEKQKFVLETKLSDVLRDPNKIVLDTRDGKQKTYSAGSKSNLDSNTSIIARAIFYAPNLKAKEIAYYLENPDKVPENLKKYFPRKSLGNNINLVKLIRNRLIKLGFLEYKYKKLNQGLRIHLNSKTAFILKAIFYARQLNPDISEQKVFEFLKAPKSASLELQKYLPPKPIDLNYHTFTQLLYLAKQDPEIKKLFDNFKRPRLATTELIMDVIKEYPEASNLALMKMLNRMYPDEEFDINRLQRIRANYLRNLIGIRYGTRTKPLPELTSEQQKFLEENRGNIFEALDYQRNKYKLSQQEFEEFKNFVEIDLIRRIATYDFKLKSIKWYLIDSINYAMKVFYKYKLKQNIGLSFKDVQLLMSILKRLREGKSLSQIAKEKNIPEQKLQELLDAYNSYASTRNKSFDELVDERRM